MRRYRIVWMIVLFLIAGVSSCHVTEPPCPAYALENVDSVEQDNCKDKQV
jgi:hypothetical protein